MQETWVWFLVWKDPPCHGATKPVCRNYWVCVLEPGNYWSPRSLDSMLCTRRISRDKEAHVLPLQSAAPVHGNEGNASAATETQQSRKETKSSSWAFSHSMCEGHVTASLRLQSPEAAVPLFSQCQGQDRLGEPTSEGCLSRSFVHQGGTPLGTQLYVVGSDWPSHTEQTLSSSPASLPATWKLQGNRFQMPQQPSLFSGFWLLLHFWSLMATYLLVISSVPLKYCGWHFKINFSGKTVQYLIAMLLDMEI